MRLVAIFYITMAEIRLYFEERMMVLKLYVKFEHVVRNLETMVSGVWYNYGTGMVH